MSEKVTIKTLWNVLEETEKCAADKSRTISNIADNQIKDIIKRGAHIAISSGFAIGIGGVAAGIASGVTAGAATGVATGAIAGVGSAAAIGSGLTIGASALSYGIGTGALGAAAGAGTGAAVGSIVPIVGTIVGVGVGLVAGVFVGKRAANKVKNEKQRLNQEVLAMQNGVIKRLYEEKDELEKEFCRTQQQNERLKYIIGLLMGFKDIESFCTA